MLDRATKQLISKARILGGKGLSIYLEDKTLVRLCAVVAVDLDRRDLVSNLIHDDDLMKGYYGSPLSWFDLEIPPSASLADIFIYLRSQISDYDTYFQCLCSLHKRRVKFEQILERQALPKMEKIVPRCLLEYGLRPSSTLASWLVWRKWLYDIDNRSAQETGYLFEPIIAAAIGGVPFSASKSPVRRRGDSSKGRQVDCLIDKTAYEFKMRVTIAASGQGRFGEELDFAKDCQASGFTPLLLVLDPTPSTRLDDLMKAFRAVGGEAHLGDDAWGHIESRAGSIMGRFVEQYVRTPVREIDRAYNDELQPVSLTYGGNEIVMKIGNKTFIIERAGAPIESDDTEDANDSEA